MSPDCAGLAQGPQLTEWRIGNFKSILEAKVAIAPLTIVTGANSSGKSSLLQSMLALTQSFCDSNERGVQLVLNGPLTRLGSARDVVFGSDVSKTLRLGFTLDCAHLVPDGVAGMGDWVSLGDYIEGFDVGFDIIVESGSIVRPWITKSQYEGHLRGFATSFEDFYQVFQTREHDHTDSWTTEDSDIAATEVVDRIGVGDFLVRWSPVKDDSSFCEVRTGIVESLSEAHSAALTRKQIFVLGQRQPVEGSPLRRERESRSVPLSYVRATSENWPLVTLVSRHLLPETVSALSDGRIGKAEEWIFAATRPGEQLNHEVFAEVRCPKEMTRWISGNLERRGVSGRAFRTRKGLNLADAASALQAVAKSQDLYCLFADNYEIVLRWLIQALPESGPEMPLVPVPLSVGLSKTTTEVLNFFRQRVHYIGPLRIEPQPTYPNTFQMARYVGHKGEETASILSSRREDRIDCPCPPPASLGIMTRATLLESTVEWLRYLGVCHDIQIVDLGRPGFEVLLRTSEKGPVHDLTHAGVGVSQVLPLVVQGLVALPGDHLIIEQPELHLHPAVQARLGDLFLALTYKGVRCIIESHSEHLIDRVRFRIASSDSDELRKKLALYFVEKPDDVSVFRRIDVDQYGALLDWPAGFFDQSTLEAEHILRAGIEKKRREMN